jgi:hypothetical protein
VPVWTDRHISIGLVIELGVGVIDVTVQPISNN